MGLESRQLIIKMAAASIILSLGGTMVGCDRDEADIRAASAIKNSDYQAAAREKQASPMLVALAARAAANNQYAATLPDSHKLTDQQLAISQSVLFLGRESQRVRRTVDSSNALSKYDPQQAMGQADQAAEQVKGGSAASWSPANTDAAIPTISALTATTNKLKDQIAEIERTLADVTRQRDTLAEQALQLMVQSNAATGQQSVDLYKQSADARKQIADLEVRIEQTQVSLVPLKQDLAVAEDQSKIAADVVASMGKVKDGMAYGWRGVSAEQGKRTELAQGWFGTKETKDANTVAGQAAVLGDLMNNYRAQSTKLQQGIDQAIGFAKEGSASSDKAYKMLSTRIQARASESSPLVDALKNMQQTADPAGAKFTQGTLELASGTVDEQLTAVYASQGAMADAVADAAKAVEQPVPEAVKGDTLKQNLAGASDKAQSILKGAATQFQSAASNSQTVNAPALKRAATIGNMSSQFASAVTAGAAGDSGMAKQFLDQVMLLRDSLKDTGPLPSLPERIQFPYAAPVAAPVAPPAESPAAPAPAPETEVK